MKTGTAISLIVHTRDSAATLPALLASTAWLDERIVIDMASTDATADMARDAGCTVVSIEPVPFTDALRNEHLARATHPWTLVLDSDERLADDAEADMRMLVAGQPENVAGIWLPRYNQVAGRILRGSGWYPDHQLRLFRTGSVRYSVLHHRPPELLDPSLSTVRLEPPGCQHIHHDNYRSLVEFMERQLHYAATDSYETDPSGYAFESYLAAGASDFHRRLQPGSDGDMSYALALLMYWNEVVRGLVHWERLGHAPPLPGEPPPLLPSLLPSPADMTPAVDPGATAELDRLRRIVRRLERENHQMKNSRSVRLTKPLRRAVGMMRKVVNRTAHPADGVTARGARSTDDE